MNPEIVAAKKIYRWLWLSPFLTVPSIVFLVFNEPGYELICGGNWRGCDSSLSQLVTGLFAVLGSGLWHLVLLPSAFNTKSEFVRWHGRQALLLAGIRTAVALGILFFYINGYYQILGLSLLILIVIWFFGTMVGQGQAASGECSLMRRAGHGAGLPLPTKTEEPFTQTGLDSEMPVEMPDYETSFYHALTLHEKGKPQEASRIYTRLLVSDAAPDLKARAAQELKKTGSLEAGLTADVLVAVFRFSRDPEQKQSALAELKSLGLVEGL